MIFALFHQVRHRVLRVGTAPLATALVLVGAGVAPAATADTGPSLDDLLGLEPDPAPTSAPAPAEPARPAEPDPAAVIDAAPPPNPIAAAAEQMELAATRLDGHRDAGLDTQRLQEDVLARLDQLIADAINNAAPPPPSGGGAGGGSGTPDNGDAAPGQGEAANGDAAGPPAGAEGPAAGSPGSNASNGGFSPGQVGPAGPAEAGPLREVRTEWGALPPRLRDELSNGLDEPFSPVYRRQTEAFYRRLAEDAAD